MGRTRGASSALTCSRVGGCACTVAAGVASLSSPPLAQWLGPAARAFWASARTAARVRCVVGAGCGDDHSTSWAMAPAAAMDRAAAARMRVACMMDFFLTS